MEQLLTVFARKVHPRLKDTQENDSLAKSSSEILELLRRLVENRTKRSCEEQHLRKLKLREAAKRLGQSAAEVKSLEITLGEQRSSFQEFREGLGRDEALVEFEMRNIEETTEATLHRQTEESLSRMLSTSLEHDKQKHSLQEEMELHENRLQGLIKENKLQEKNLRDSCFESKRAYLKELSKYDEDIRMLHCSRNALLADKELLEREYTDIKGRLNVQRVLYEELKMERELAIRKAFLEQVNIFRRNRAAKIIQKTWRMHCERVASKKKRSRR